MIVDFPSALGSRSFECFNFRKAGNNEKRIDVKFGQAYNFGQFYNKDSWIPEKNSLPKLNYDGKKLSEDDIAEIKEYLKTGNEDELCLLATAVAKSKDPRKDNFLLALSSKKYDTVKCNVAKALGQIEKPKTVSKIVERLKRSNDPKIKTELGKAVGGIKDENTRNLQFIELYSLKDPDIDAGLAQNLGSKKIDKDNLGTVIMGYSRHNDPKIRALAALNLDNTNNEDIYSTYKVLRQLCCDENEDVRKNAALNIALAYNDDFRNLPIDDPDFLYVMNEPETFFDLNDPCTREKAKKIEKLAELKQKQDPDFVFDWDDLNIMETLDVLDKLADPANREELDKLVRLKRKDDPGYRFNWEDPYLIEKVKHMIMPDFLSEKRVKGKSKISEDYDAIINTLAKDPDGEIRYNLVIGLSKIPDKEKRDDFLCCFSTKSSKERQAVAKVIDKVSDPDKCDEIIERLSDPENRLNSDKVMEYTAPALAKVKNPEVFGRVCRNLLKTHNKKVKIGVAEILEKISPKYRDGVAECISEDSDPDVLRILAENAKHMINRERRERLYHKLFLKYTNSSSKLRQQVEETHNTFNTVSPPIYQ